MSERTEVDTDSVAAKDTIDERELGASATMPRRLFLGTAAAGTAAAVLAACGGGGSKTATPAASPPVTMAQTPAQATLGTDAMGFALFSEPIINFNSLFAAGASGTAAAFGEVITATQQAQSPAGGATFQSYFDAMNAMGNQLAAAAAQSLKDGHLISARDRYLRAATYFDQALFFVLGTSTPGAWLVPAGTGRQGSSPDTDRQQRQ